MLLGTGRLSQLSTGLMGLVTPVQAAPFASQRVLQLGEASGSGGLSGVIVKQVRPPALTEPVTAG